MLQVLPQNISNLIAAGEVVSRPASVVKELVENAIDAGASTVSVIISDSGRTLIRVVDDGCGMSPSDAVLCFERHATSKIAAAEDLERIMTYGFRGEALASIAAVAQITLQTRREGDEVGTRVEVAASSIISQEECSCPQGTSFSIQNIFYNVPARRKFLKSDSVELRNIIQEFLRVALTRPDISLRLTVNGKETYNLRKVSNLKQRIHDVYGMNISNDLVEISVETSVANIRGYIGNPKDALKRQGNQFLFVNGRFFRSPFFNKAVCRPYEKLIPEGSSPAYFIYLEVDPGKMDVNIHPAKTEIKFEDESVIFEILSACVREGLGKNDFTPSIDFDMAGAPEIPAYNPSGNFSGNSCDRSYSYSPVQPSIGFDPLFNPFDGESFRHRETEFESQSDVAPRLFSEGPDADSSAGTLVLGHKYIVVPVKSGMMLINIRRARERVFYEKYMECIGEDQPITQQTLFPVTLNLSAEDHLTLLEQPDLLEKMGFDIRDFGSDSVVVYGLPEGYSSSEEDVRRCIDELVAALRDDTAMDDYRHTLAAKMAVSASVCGLSEFKKSEAQLLVDMLFACREPSTTPDGHKCMSIVSFEELDKLI